MGARIGAIRNSVPVHVQITAELLACLEVGSRHDLAAIVFAAVVPGERPAQAMVHPDIEVEHHEDRGLQAIRQVEGIRREVESLGRVLRKEEDMLSIAMRRVRAGDQIALLGARRHAGRGARALHIEDHRGDFGEIGKAQELLHQGNAGAGSGSEGARAVPCSPDHNTNGSELVLGLNDRNLVLLGRRVDPQPSAMACERVRERRGRGDGIPSANGSATIKRTKRRGRVAFDEDVVTHGIGALQAQAEGTS